MVCPVMSRGAILINEKTTPTNCDQMLAANTVMLKECGGLASRHIQFITMLKISQWIDFCVFCKLICICEIKNHKS